MANLDLMKKETVFSKLKINNCQKPCESTLPIITL